MIRAFSRLLTKGALGGALFFTLSAAALPLNTRNCSPDLAALLNNGEIPLSTRLMLRPLATAQSDRAKWFESSIASALKRSLRQQLDWARLHREGVQAGESVFWIQQSELKGLNERFWDIGGTEYYLLTLDKILGDVLEEQPHLGRLVHRNYKDRVIVSKLSPREFDLRVMASVKARLTRKIQQVRPTLDTSTRWSQYIDHSIKVGSGDSLVGAHLSLKLRALNLSFAGWRSEAISLRNQLSVAASARGLEWGEVLRTARTLSKEPVETLDLWLERKGWDRAAGNRVRRYLRLASVADFLPTNEVPNAQQIQQIEAVLRNVNEASLEALADRPLVQRLAGGAWDFERSLFLEEGLSAHYMAATDIEGLGARALLAQDHWIAQGARMETLPQVYEGTTRYLEGVYKEIEDGLREILGQDAKISLYRSGDDGLWGLPEMSPLTLGRVQRFLAQKGGVYSHLQEISNPGSAQGVAEAVYESRRRLFSSKHAPLEEAQP